MPDIVFTEREEQIITAAVERAFLILPEAVESMIMQKTTTKRLADELFKDKDLSANLGLVQSIIEKTEIENPGLSYGKIIELATPKIKERIKLLSGMNYQPVPKPSTLLEGPPAGQPDFGEL